MSDNSSQVTSKGQVTIPAKIRKKFKLTQGTRVTFVETEEGVLLKPALSEMRKLRGILKDTNISEIAEDIVSNLRKEWRIDQQ